MPDRGLKSVHDNIERPCEMLERLFPGEANETGKTAYRAAEDSRWRDGRALCIVPHERELQ